jgi:phosphoribosylglycinamide formyltransferase 1
MSHKVAVLASGGGTTVEAFVRAGQRGEISSSVGIVIASREDAGVFQRIERLNSEYGLSIECVLINHRTHPKEENEQVGKGFQTKAEELAILDLIKGGSFDIVSLMGYMKRIGPRLIDAFGWKPGYTSIYEASMLNTHPGILPDTKAMYGLQIQKYVLDRNLPYGGQTLHLVSAGYDEGPIIAEHRVEVKNNDTAEDLFARVQCAEKKFLPGDIEAFILSRSAFLKSNLTETES